MNPEQGDDVFPSNWIQDEDGFVWPPPFALSDSDGYADQAGMQFQADGEDEISIKFTASYDMADVYHFVVYDSDGNVVGTPMKVVPDTEYGITLPSTADGAGWLSLQAHNEPDGALAYLSTMVCRIGAKPVVPGANVPLPSGEVSPPRILSPEQGSGFGPVEPSSNDATWY